MHQLGISARSLSSNLPEERTLTTGRHYSMGFARLAEQSIRKARGVAEGEKLGAMDRIAASTIGGALGCWNQPIEVVRVEVRSPFSFLLPPGVRSSRTALTWMGSADAVDGQD
mgnify:FL=1